MMVITLKGHEPLVRTVTMQKHVSMWEAESYSQSIEHSHMHIVDMNHSWRYITYILCRQLSELDGRICCKHGVSSGQLVCNFQEVPLVHLRGCSELHVAHNFLFRQWKRSRMSMVYLPSLKTCRTITAFLFRKRETYQCEYPPSQGSTFKKNAAVPKWQKSAQLISTLSENSIDTVRQPDTDDKLAFGQSPFSEWTWCDKTHRNTDCHTQEPVQFTNDGLRSLKNTWIVSLIKISIHTGESNDRDNINRVHL